MGISKCGDNRKRVTAKMWVSSLLKKIYLFIWLHMVWVSVVGHQLSFLMAEVS